MSSPWIGGEERRQGSGLPGGRGSVGGRRRGAGTGFICSGAVPMADGKEAERPWGCAGAYSRVTASEGASRAGAFAWGASGLQLKPAASYPPAVFHLLKECLFPSGSCGIESCKGRREERQLGSLPKSLSSFLQPQVNFSRAALSPS